MAETTGGARERTSHWRRGAEAIAAFPRRRQTDRAEFYIAAALRVARLAESVPAPRTNYRVPIKKTGGNADVVVLSGVMSPDPLRGATDEGSLSSHHAHRHGDRVARRSRGPRIGQRHSFPADQRAPSGAE